MQLEGVFFLTMGEITASLCTDCNAPKEREKLMERDRKIAEALIVIRKSRIVCVCVCVYI